MRRITPFLCLALGGCISITRFVTDNGYTATRPASKLYPPGSIVYVHQKSPLVLGLVCTPDNNVGPGISVIQTPSTSLQQSASSKSKIGLDAGYLSVIKGNLNLDIVKEVSLNISNVTLWSLPTTAFVTDKRDPKCQKAIDYHRSHGRQVSAIFEAMEASATYQVTVNTKAAAAANVDLNQWVNGLAANLGVSVENASQMLLKGSNLFYGFKDDRDLTDLTDARTKAAGVHNVIPIAPSQLCSKQTTVEWLESLNGAAPPDLPPCTTAP